MPGPELVAPLLVLPHPRCRGAHSWELSEEGELLARAAPKGNRKRGRKLPAPPLVDGMAALRRCWPTDAHAQMLAVRGPSGWVPTPRLNKSGMVSLPDGYACMLTWALADIDTPDHVELDDALRERALDFIEEAARAADLPRPLSYTTRGGARAAWQLAQPLDVGAVGVEELENYLRGVRQRLADGGGGAEGFATVGLCVPDEAAGDLGRLFRLPFVDRGGIAQRYPARLGASR